MAALGDAAILQRVLRGVAAPTVFSNDGSAATLEDVVQVYNTKRTLA